MQLLTIHTPAVQLLTIHSFNAAVDYSYTCTCIQKETSLETIIYRYSCCNILRRSFMFMINCPAQYPIQILCTTLEFLICNCKTICRPIVMLDHITDHVREHKWLSVDITKKYFQKLDHNLHLIVWQEIQLSNLLRETVLVRFPNVFLVPSKIIIMWN